MKAWRELRALPRPVWLVFTVTVVNRSGTMALPFLLLYLTRQLGFSLAEAGLVVSAYGIGALGISPIAGWLCDRWGTVRVMLLSLFSSALMMLVIARLTSYLPILVATVLWAVVAELLRPAIFTSVGGMVHGPQRKIALTVMRLAANLGMSIGPVIGGFLAERSFTLVFYCNAAASALAGLVLAWSQYRLPQGQRESAPAPGLSMIRSFRGCLSDRRLLYFLIAMLPVEIVFFQHESMLANFVVNDLHLRTADYGLIFTVNTLLICFTEIPLNVATAHWPHRVPLVLGSVLFALGFGSMAIAHSFGAVIAAGVVWTVGEMMVLPQATAYLNDLAPPTSRGAYTGVYLMSFSIAFILAPTLGGAVVQAWGSAALWAGCLGAGLLSALMLLRTSDASSTFPPSAAE